MARIEIAKGMTRVNGRKMPPISTLGRLSRTDRWSVVHRKVANDCRKKSRPPVASSWLIGALVRIGEMISRCTAMPSRAPTTSVTGPASHTDQPCPCTMK